jgi:hypothetical protein
MIKKLLIFISLLPSGLWAQTSPLIESNSIWRVHVHISLSTGLGQNSDSWTECNDFLKDDTLISGLLYKKVYRTGVHYETNSSPHSSNASSSPICNLYMGAIRTDNSRHVYMVKAESSVPKLLYDFNLSAGDTLQPTLICTGYFRVESIDSVLINSIQRKRYNLKGINYPFDTTSIVEGVGALTGLINPFQTPVNGLYRLFSRLKGFYQDSALVYNPFLSNPVSLMNCSKVNNIPEISVFPNPTSGNFFISSLQYTDCKLYIYNYAGQKIIETYLNAPQTEINLSEYASGMYFLILQNDNFSITEKIIKH